MEENELKGIKGFVKKNKKPLMIIFIIYLVFINLFFFSAVFGFNPMSSDADNKGTVKTSPTVIKETATPKPTSTPRPTKTPRPTSTPRPTLSAEQIQETKVAKTQEVIDAINDLKESSKEVEYRDFVTYTQKYIDEKEMIHIWGRVFNINSDQELQIWISNSSEAVYILSIEPYEGIYEGDIIDAWGLATDIHCGTNAYGGEVCQPLFAAMIIEKR